MSSCPNPRKLIHPTSATARASIPFPFPHDVDLAPQLIAVTLAQAALAAIHRAVDSAHPVLAFASRLDQPPDLTDSEHFAVLVLHVGNQLAGILSDYAAAVVQDIRDLDQDSLPF